VHVAQVSLYVTGKQGCSETERHAAGNSSVVVFRSELSHVQRAINIMYGNNKESGLFPVGELAAAKQFQSGFAMARRVAPGFPVLTATLGHFEYRAIESEAVTAGTFALEVVSHPSADLLKISLQVGGLRVHWLADESASELREAMEKWERAGKAAFALWLPDGAPCNCLFGALELSESFEAKSVMTSNRKTKTAHSSDVFKAIIETGNALQDASFEQLGISNNRELVHVLLTNRIKKNVRQTFGSSTANFLSERPTETMH
jgi:hypothetical protein